LLHGTAHFFSKVPVREAALIRDVALASREVDAAGLDGAAAHDAAVEAEHPALAPLVGGDGKVLPFRVVEAEYSEALDRIVMVTGEPNRHIDLLVRPTPENASRVLLALERFGAPLAQHGVTEGLFFRERYGYRIGRKPLLIEILTAIDGVDFEEASVGAILVEAEGLTIPVIGRQALIKNKRAAGRAKDLADVDALEPGTHEES
jgi:hypothetical protein